MTPLGVIAESRFETDRRLLAGFRRTDMVSEPPPRKLYLRKAIACLGVLGLSLVVHGVDAQDAMPDAGQVGRLETWKTR